VSGPDYDELFKGRPGSVLGRHRDPEPTPEERKAVEAKIRRAQEKRPAKERPWNNNGRRLPPGQAKTQEFPILDLGHRPLIDTRDWRLTVAGAVERRLDWDWQAFMAAPQTTITTDIHCVTEWSRFDNAWQGVAGRTLLEIVRPRPEARLVV